MFRYRLIMVFNNNHKKDTRKHTYTRAPLAHKHTFPSSLFTRWSLHCVNKAATCVLLLLVFTDDLWWVIPSLELKKKQWGWQQQSTFLKSEQMHLQQDTDTKNIKGNVFQSHPGCSWGVLIYKVRFWFLKMRLQVQVTENSFKEALPQEQDRPQWACMFSLSSFRGLLGASWRIEFKCMPCAGKPAWEVDPHCKALPLSCWTLEKTGS